MSSLLRIGISIVAAALILVILRWPQTDQSKSGIYKPAVTSAAGALQQNPQSTPLRLQYLGQLLQAYREVSDTAYLQLAEEAIAKGKAMNPEEVEYDFYAAQIALTRHHFAEALKLALPTIKARPDTARFYGPVVDAYVELGRYNEAVELLQKMVNLRPDFSSYSRIAYVRELYGDLPGAATAFDSAVQAGSAIPENRAWALTHKANLLVATEPAEAKSLYGQALQIQGNFAPALLGEAKIAFINGENDLAEEKLLAAFSAQPLPDYAVYLADFYLSQGKTAESKKYTSIATLAFDSARTAGNQVDMEEADFLLHTGENKERALELAKSAYSVRPSVIAANVLAKAYLVNGNIEEAKKMNTQALRLTAEVKNIASHASIAATAGDIATSEGKSDKAKEWYAIALRIDPAFSFTSSNRLRSSNSLLSR